MSTDFYEITPCGLLKEEYQKQHKDYEKQISLTLEKDRQSRSNDPFHLFSFKGNVTLYECCGDKG